MPRPRSAQCALSQAAARAAASGSLTSTTMNGRPYLSAQKKPLAEERPHARFVALAAHLAARDRRYRPVVGARHQQAPAPLAQRHQLGALGRSVALVEASLLAI